MIEALLVVIVVILAVGIALAAVSVRVLREYERAVVFRLGRMIDVKVPGVVLLTPAVGGMARLLGVVDRPGGRRVVHLVGLAHPGDRRSPAPRLFG